MKTMRMTDLKVSGAALGLAFAMIFGAARFAPEPEPCTLCADAAATTAVEAVPAAEVIDCASVLASVTG